MTPAAVPAPAAVLPGAEYFLAGIFLFFVAATVGGALLAVAARRIIRSVCGLALACLGVAGLYYFLNSPFLALMELLIYVGAVCVTIVFAVMLAEHEEPAEDEKGVPALLWGLAASVAAAALFWSLSRFGVFGDWPVDVVQKDGSIQAIGVSLLTTYSMAFEVISLVLLVAILGALAIARTGRQRA